MTQHEMAADEVTEGQVISRDGTRIGFLRQGRGPGLVLVQGAMGTAHNYADLARALAPVFTVYRPDRRGRGRSPKTYDSGHDIARDVEDVDAVLIEAGASYVFGLSSGAMITLAAARSLPRITRAAVYEPPFYARDIDRDGIRRLGSELDRGDLAAALVTALLTAETAPAPLRILPRPVARLLAAVVLRVDDRTHGRYARLRDMLPGIRYDFADVAAAQTQRTGLTTLDTPVLLLGGTKSPAFLRAALRDLEDHLPRARRIEIDGLSHSGPWNSGGPDLVAGALRTFLTDQARTARSAQSSRGRRFVRRRTARS